MRLHGLYVMATGVLACSCIMMVTVEAALNLTECFTNNNLTKYFPTATATANISVNVTLCNNTDNSTADKAVFVTILIMNDTIRGDKNLTNFTCGIGPGTTPEPTTTKPANTETRPAAPQTTATGASSGQNLANQEENLKDTNENQTTEFEKIEVLFTKGKQFGTKEKPAFRSKFTNTLVGGVALSDDVKENVLAKMVVVGMKREKIETGFIALPTPPDKNDGSEIIASVFGDEFIGISVYDDNTTEKLDVKNVEIVFDVASSASKRRYREKIFGAVDKEKVARIIVQSIEPGCSFFNVTKQSWDTEGCKVEKWEKDKSVDCKCTHTTIFAVMMSAVVVEVPNGVKIASYITELASILFLLITLIFLVKVRNRVRGDRVKVQICLTFSLLCLHSLNVLHDAAVLNNTVCELWTVLTHYFFLCSGMWMLMEGITLLFKTLDGVMRLLSGKNSRKFAIFRYVVSFVIPAIIVIVSAAVGFSSDNVHYMPLSDGYIENDTYGKYKHCWVGSDMLLGTVIIPVSVLLACCLLIAARMFYVVYRMSVESENFKPTDQRRNTTVGEMEDLIHIKAALKATLVLLPVLGIPWFLGFFTGIENGGARVAFMYVNAIINGLQGVMLFFVYCVLGKEVRKAIVNSFVRKKHTLPSFFEFSSDKRRMTTDHSSYSTTAHATLSTNMGEQSSQGERRSSNSLDGEN